ncbi:MAG: D-alanine--D-alanine ligase [Bowdeniella nasicola]|nr:D-alanine--D-alanine ligase [Bowdeniella nasicola]
MMNTDPKQTHVLILSGGLSHERDVSLRSGNCVANILKDSGYQVSIGDVDTKLLETIARESPDVVWPLIHGAEGEDGSLQDLLELLGVAYVGTSADGCRLASRKSVAKSVLQKSWIPTQPFALLPHTLFRQLGARGILAAIERSLGFPLVVKPDDGGSALGVSVIDGPDQLPAAMVSCFAYSDYALLERAVTGREVAISVIDIDNQPQALPPVEIVADGPYDYDARYNTGRTEYFTPARLHEELANNVKELAVAVHQVLGLRHISRVDVMIDEDDRPWVIDINVAPGMTETSLFPQAVAKSVGNAIYGKIVEAALRDAQQVQQQREEAGRAARPEHD